MVKPLSELTERLQSLSKSKHDDSLFTGSEFVSEYGTPGQPLDSEPNKTIATAGGDLQHAYSKLHSVYMRARDANDAAKNEFKVSGEATKALNTAALVGDLDYAVESLESAAEKLESCDVSIAAEVRDLRDHVAAHRDRIDETGMVSIN